MQNYILHTCMYVDLSSLDNQHTKEKGLHLAEKAFTCHLENSPKSILHTYVDFKVSNIRQLHINWLFACPGLFRKIVIKKSTPLPPHTHYLGDNLNYALHQTMWIMGQEMLCVLSHMDNLILPFAFSYPQKNCHNYLISRSLKFPAPHRSSL